MYDAINKGMKMATGDVIGILNSDDMLDAEDVHLAMSGPSRNQVGRQPVWRLEYVDPVDTNKIA